jgi:hypothetical protein
MGPDNNNSTTKSMEEQLMVNDNKSHMEMIEQMWFS